MNPELAELLSPAITVVGALLVAAWATVRAYLGNSRTALRAIEILRSIITSPLSTTTITIDSGRVDRTKETGTQEQQGTGIPEARTHGDYSGDHIEFQIVVREARVTQAGRDHTVTIGDDLPATNGVQSSDEGR
ncbi:hypothetical protein [Nonomuraea sp. 10N515B]|uniref:hypothetical protein n=1 Tax=Nonomuraea sp. 10N515B TaxID=3457422 RepID=UPI003FCE4960